MSKITIWLTPLWLLAVGVTIGAAVLVALWGICWLVNRKAAGAIAVAVSETVLRPMSYAVVSLAAFALLASPAMPVRRAMESVARLPAVQSISKKVTVPANTGDFEVSAAFRADELKTYTIASSQDVAVNVEAGKKYVEPLLKVSGGDPYAWTPGGNQPRAFAGEASKLYITNESDQPADVSLEFNADVVTPEVRSIPIAAASTVGLFLFYLAVHFLARRTSVIAQATAKETISQPLFVMLTVIGVVALVAYVFTPYNTFGEDVKMLKTSGMTTIKVLAIILALWTASTSVADEIEGRTALTVLSKPVGRRQFILGKFLGIVWPILLLFIILGFVFLISVSFKVVYDARESAKTTPEWPECYVEVARIIPGLVLSFFEAVIMAAISVAVSTRLPMLPNLVICGSIYVIGHLTPLIIKSSVNDLVFVQFIGKLLSIVFPVLDNYEIEGAVAGASEVPMNYLGYSLTYTLLYCAAAMLLALIFFEDRDLA